MPTPYLDSDTFRTLTRVKQSRLGIDTPAGDALLAISLERAAAYVEFVTGQPAMDSAMPALATSSGAVSATAAPTMILQAIQMRTEQIAFQSQNGYIDDATDDVTQSISVGGFSQTKKDTARRGEERQLNSWQALSNLLWLLMTPDRIQWWVAFLSTDPELMIGPVWSIDQTFQQSAGPEGGWGFGFGGLGFGMADYALSGFTGLPDSGWQGGGGFLPGGMFPLTVD